MAGDLKGLTVQIGGNTTELGKALETIKTKTTAASKELTQINRLLKLDPGNTDLLAQKQTVLAEKIAATKQKLEVLKQAQEQAAAAFADGKIGESEYRKIERDVIAAQQELESLQNQAKETGDALKDSAKKGADGAKKTADAEKEIGNEAKSAEKKVSSFGDVLKGTLAAHAIISGAKAIARGVKSIFTAVSESAQELGTLSDNAEKVSMSAETLQSWQYAAKMVGFDNEQLVKTMEKQQKAFASAKTGSDSLRESYAAIGVDIDKINSSEDAFEATINALAQCTDETQRNAIANDIFGKSYADLAPLLNMGAEKIAQMRQEAYDLGLVVSNDAVAAGDEFADTMDTISMQVDTAKAKLVSGMVPALQQFSGELEKKLGNEKTQAQLKKTGAALGDLAGKALNLTAKVLPVLADGLAIITKNGKEVAIAAGATVVAIKGFSIVSTAKAAVKGFTTAIHGMNAAISSNPIGLMLTAISSLIAILMTLSAVIDTAVEKQAELADAYQDAADSALDAQRKRAQGAKDIQSEYDEYRNLVKELDGLVDADGRVKEGYENRVNYIFNELADATGTEIKLVDGVIEKYDELSASIGNVLIKKQAEAYITANQSEYDTAKTNISSMEKDENGNYVAGSQAAAEQAQQTLANYKLLLSKYDAMQIEFDSLTAQYNMGLISESDMLQQQTEIGKEMNNIMHQLGGSTTRNEAVEFISQAEGIAKDATYAYDQNKAIIAQFEGVQSAVWADDAEGISAALESATSARMTAADATLSSLEKQRDAAIEEYNQYLEWSQQEGSSVTQEQVSGKAQAAVAAAMEAHIKMIAEGDQHTQEEIEASRAQLEALMTAVTGESQNEITNLINSIESDAKTAGSSYVDGIVQGLRINGYKAYNAGYDLGEEVDKGYRAGTKTESPSKVARKSASWYPVGVALGIADTENQPVNAVKRMAQKLKTALNGEIGAYALDFGAWGGNLSRYEKNTMVNVPTDLGGIFDRLERIRASVDAIDPNVYLDGQKVSDRLTGYTDVGLGRRAADQQRGRMK